MCSQTNKERPSWDETHMNVALEYARRSKVPTTKVGAVIVKDRRIVSPAYNGKADGQDEERIGNYELDDYHAEMNAIGWKAKEGGTGLEGSTIFVTVAPCIHCAKLIVRSGIKRVVCIDKVALNQDACPDGLQHLIENNITVHYYEEDTKRVYLYRTYASTS
jgi:dCMP deaminase